MPAAPVCSHRFIPLAIAMVAIASMLTGCSDRDDGKPKVRSKQGIAKKIDVDNRTVSMAITNKKGDSIVLDGTFRDDTVVTINGRTQSIRDIREGDSVTVEGYKEGDGLNAKWIAVRVTVDRPNEKDWKSTGQGATPATSPAPTTQPANG